MGQGRSVGTAETIRSSGVGGAPRDELVGDNLVELEVPLVQIRRPVAEQTHEGDPVHVVLTAEGMPVGTLSGILGQVPSSYRRRVRRAGLGQGHVLSLDLDPLSCTVLLSVAET